MVGKGKITGNCYDFINAVPVQILVTTFRTICLFSRNMERWGTSKNWLKRQRNWVNSENNKTPLWLPEYCQFSGIKIILDYVPNHTSDQHEWFIKSEFGDPEYKDYFIWSDGRPNPEGGLPLVPNNWVSVFYGSAWTWSDRRQQFYFHQFTKQQVLGLFDTNKWKFLTFLTTHSPTWTIEILMWWRKWKMYCVSGWQKVFQVSGAMR